MKHFTTTLLLLLIIGSAAFGQYTVTLPTVTASPNENVAIPLNVTGFTSIGSIQLFIKVDHKVLTLLSITGFSQTGLVYGSGVTGDTIRIIWTNVTPHTWANGTLLTMNFKYNGLSSTMNFIPSQCEVAKFVGGIPTVLTGTFNNGAISPYQGNAEQAHIGNVFAVTGNAVAVPLWYSSTSTNPSAANITQKIAYDATKLTFVNVTGTGVLSTGITSSAASGIITLTWANASGALINTPGSHFNLNFTYTGSTTTSVTFSTGCIITAPTSGNNIAVTYFNGSVLHSGAITAFASLPNLTTAVQNQTIDVPLTFSGMPSGITTINLTLAYDNPRMSFVSVVSPMYMGTITTNAAGSYICLTYTNPSGPAINGQFLVLRFMYNGIGTANISFSSPCQFINGSPVQVGYTNGSVSPAPIANNIAQIGYVTGISGTPVDVPITFSSMPTDIGAVTMSVVFDQTKLTYVKESDNPYNAFVQVKNNVITIAWMSGSPTNINGSFITLMFDYVSDPTPDCGPAAITFGDGCQVASTPSGAIVPTNWLNGGVNLKFKITGTLTYDSDPSPRLPMEGYTIYLKSGANVIATTTTAAGTGFFEFLEPNGTYTLEAAVPVGKIWYGDFDDEYYLLDYLIYGNTFPYDNPLRELAADLDQNGSVDFDDDYFLLERLIYDVKDPLWTAPDYLFENPTVVVSCTDVTKDFMGLCSGNINGANSTP